MVGTAHVYQIYIAAMPEEVWRAITDSEWTKRYFHATSFVAPPVRPAKRREAWSAPIGRLPSVRSTGCTTSTWPEPPDWSRA